MPFKKGRTLTFAKMKKHKGLYPNFSLKHNDESFSIYKHINKNLAMVVFHPFQTIDLFAAKRIEQHVFLIVDKQKPIYGITLPSEGSSADRDCRSYFANCELSQKYTKAMAVIIQSMPHRMLFNFYTQFNRPPAKHRAFEELDNAVEWLEEQGC
ncbi:MAG: hypothetical protein WD530_02900 [Vicingaceae bacterium]